MGATKSFANAKRLYYWPDMFDWIFALTDDCLICQKNKPEPKHMNEVSLEEWRNDTIPFRTVHIDHKGPLHPPSNRNYHCLLVIDAFSRFLMVYPVAHTSAQTRIAALRSGSILSEFRNPLSMIEVLPLSIQTLLNGQMNLASHCDRKPVTLHGQMGKLGLRIGT